MDQKQAYCCLNCRNLPPCNAASGNCKECCEDCQDFSNEVKLYDLSGKIVDSSVIGATYNPSTPIRTWSAGCHFFHP